MQILLLGSGGREHALAYKIAQSKWCSQLFIAPGNGGTKSLGTNVEIDPLDFAGIEQFISENKIEILVVGPEKPAVMGIYDYFKERKPGLIVISASKEGAKLEGSKAYAKEFMKENNIPTAAYCEVTIENIQEGIDFLKSQKPPYVLKADGLAEGKGVVILNALDEAIAELKRFIEDKKFGASSEKVVIEEFLKGIEFSIFIYTNGKEYKILPNAKDYKRIGEGDTGLNTGGMGCISPVPFVDEDMMETVTSEVIEPTIQGLINRNIDYNGFIYLGLINVDGQPKVIEYNCRMGDPETEVVMPRLKSDLVELFIASKNNLLKQTKVELDERFCVTVMLVSGGYPLEYQKGKLIEGLNDVKESKVFHAGTIESNTQFYTNGGRVLAVTSYGNTLDRALKKSYESIEKIKFDKMNYRKDIGYEFINPIEEKLKDHFAIGFIASLLLTGLTYFLINRYVNLGQMDVITHIDKSMEARMLQLAILPNAGLFFLSLHLNKEKIAKGIFGGLIAVGLLIVYLWFFR